MLDTDHLRTFVAVAETQNFTKAGEVVGRTQSAVSIQMRKLEDSLGEPLFERSSRGVALTHQGAQLLIRARRVIAMLKEAEVSVKGSHLRGLVRIGIPEEYSTSVLPTALRTFDAVHPGVEIIVTFGRSSSNAAALAKGDLDICVVYETGGITEQEVLQTDPTVWVTSAIYEQHLLSPLPVAMYTGESWCRTMALDALKDRGLDFRMSYLGTSTGGLIAGVLAGLAIAPLSRSSVPSNCRELTAEDGFPVIDHSNVILIVSQSNPSDAVQGMASAIRQAFFAQR
ncbi:DNA-binding transcriptional LysR family regulator [Pararhizobium capsulatum DSM 1112]|uniref:DNA-binding transcriptional LysR family regulator n=1 Tax=Pararhizobium capsulatum DSM 1112 TaxID=1121113 RepID=A0ABU0C244_9HYPH|nr:LysR family transcriptional regulator [Pararhizobium capsulatum]MDQ0323182.1 DNA-binding transcriptional LysR family regulator [Pararhizobium capsulatum DSM 1112]